MSHWMRRFPLTLGLVALILFGAFYAVRAGQTEENVSTRSAEARDLYREGMEHWLQYRYAAADSAWGEACALDPGFALAWGRRSLLASTQHREADARRFITEAKAHRRGITELEQLRIAWWDSRVERQTGTKGREALEEIIRRYPDDHEAWFALYSVEFNEGNLDRAAQCLLRVIEVNPASILAYNNLGYLYAEMGRWDEAIDTLRKYAFINTDEANPHDSLGEIYERIGRYEEAQAEYRRAVAADSAFFFAYVHDARVEHNLGRTESALRRLRTARERYISGAQAQNLLVGEFSALLRAGRLEEADAVLEQVEVDPVSRSTAEVMRAQIRAARGQVGLVEAVAESLHAADVGRDASGLLGADGDPNVNIVDGLLLEARRDYGDAARLYSDFLRRNFIDFDVNDWMRLRTTENFCRAAEWDSCVAHADRTLSRNPNHPTALYWKAKALDGAGRAGEAQVLWDRLAGLWRQADPGHPWAAEMRRRLGQPLS